MPGLNNRALLLQLEAFIAENNIRRGVLLVASNIQSANGSVNERSGVISAGATLTFDVLSPNSGTVVKCTGGPLQVSATIDANVTPTVFNINSLFVITSPVTALTLTNHGTTDVQIRILQI